MLERQSQILFYGRFHKILYDLSAVCHGYDIIDSITGGFMNLRQLRAEAVSYRGKYRNSLSLFHPDYDLVAT